MSKLLELRNEIEELKMQLKNKQSQFRQDRGLLTERQVKNMNVKELRKLVKKNKIFKGISLLKKKEIISKIIDSSWFAQQPPPLPPRKGAIKVRIKKPVKTIKIKMKTPVLRELEDDTPSALVSTSSGATSTAPSAPFIPPPAPFIQPPPLREEKKEEKEGKEEKTIELGEGKEDDQTQTIEPDVHNIHLKFKKGSKGKKQLDLGHTIVNIFVGSNQHPDYPIPQSLVRSALEAQQLPPQQEQKVSRFLREEAKRTPISRSTPSKPSKKFPPVRTRPAPRREVKEEEEEEFQPTSGGFDDDSEEEESPADKARRERQEQMRREMSRSKGKGRKDAFKNKLEGLLSQRL